MPQPGKKPTLRDVADLAGVSHQTVSRVVNNSDSVLPVTRRRVEKAIRKLGYHPNVIARSMAQGRTFTIACISPNLVDFTFASIIEAAESEARQHGYLMYSCTAPDEQSFSKLVEEMVIHRQVDGLMVLNPYIDNRWKYFPRNIPLIIVGSSSRDPLIPSVNIGNVDAGYQATHYLLEQGHTRIGQITGPQVEDCSLERLEGFLAALQGANIHQDPCLTIEGDWSATSGFTAMERLLTCSPAPTAVFAQNDRMAIGCIRAVRDAGLKCPEDISVVGFDDIPLASYFDPPLTTMRQDLAGEGIEAARLLINKILQPEVQYDLKLVTPGLLIRGSVRNIQHDRR